MRITNKIMQNNNLSNINTNKIYQDTLSTQMSTQKKINKPSDDPVVAIRALRLRSNVTEISQYYSKNIPDAESWLSVTEDALKNMGSIITNMIAQITKGSNGDLATEDRDIIMEQLKALSEEVYATGDADYAGRYVFTGYRTDTSLSFKETTKQSYTITEQVGPTSLDSVSVVNTGNLLNWNSGIYMSDDLKDINETEISSGTAHRLRLSYSSCDENYAPSISVQDLDADGRAVTDDDGNLVFKDITDINGAWTTEIMHSYDVPAGYSNPYEYVADNDDAVVYIPETGEMLLGENVYKELASRQDNTSTMADESQIRVTYQKEEWVKGDLRPEHYFYCQSEDVEYNPKFLSIEDDDQAIEYDVGFNQTIRVNSTARECFKPGIGRAIDDLANAMANLDKIELVKGRIEAAKANATGDELKTLESQYEAIEKSYALEKDNVQKLFESSITTMQKYLDSVNLSMTNCGTRSSKLELIESRMQNQKTTFEILKSENEDVDITEVAINLNSAELTYEAALMATGKVAKTTLLDYI